MAKAKDITLGNEDIQYNLRIPPFWPEDPDLWFAQLERQFTLCNITSDSVKYSPPVPHRTKAKTRGKGYNKLATDKRKI